MDNLIDILNKYDIDGFHKEGGTDKNFNHSYLNYYEIFLNPFKSKHIHLLEIGIQFGGSALLWQDYFPLSEIILIDKFDLMDKKVKDNIDYQRCKIYKMDAYSNASINKLKSDYPNGFDVIIDDGPHKLETQMIFIKKYFPMLKPGGIMFIEDIQNYYDVNILLSQIPTEYKKNTKILDLRNIKKRYDDILIITKKF